MKNVVILLLLPFLLSFVLNIAFRKEYEVFQAGIVVISGASTGIGHHASIHLANNGYTVFAGVRKEKDFQSIQNLKIPTLLPLQFDVTDHQSCVKALQTVQQFSLQHNNLPIIGLINNAGVSRKVLAELHDLNDARRVFDTNFFGMVDLTQLFLPVLRQSHGRIVMISSLSGLVGSPMSSIYVASKFAMEGFTDSLRREIAQFGISVSIIEPGYVKSSIFATSEEESVVPEDKKEVVNQFYSQFYSEQAKQKRQKTLQLADDPKVTTNAIFHAMTAKYPQTRYPVANATGIPAIVIDWIRWLLPDRLLDLFL